MIRSLTRVRGFLNGRKPQMRGYPDFRWNFLFFGADLSFFSLALSLSSTYTILPLFVHHLTSSNFFIGLIPAIRQFSLLFPQLFIANYVERLSRKKPFVLWATILERAPYAVLLVGTLLLATRHPNLLLTLFYLCIFITMFGGGITLSAWLDIIARAMPPNWRGRFFGTSSAVGGIMGLAGAGLATYLLAHYPFPTNFALCFLFSCLALGISYICLWVGREPDNARPKAAQSAGAYFRGLIPLLRRDRNFSWYLVASILVTISSVATGFYAVAGAQALRLPDKQAGITTGLLLLASTTCYFIWGFLGDHYGHKRVLECGTACGMAAALLALLGLNLVSFYLIFVLLGASISAIMQAAFTFVVDFGSEADRPTYIGLANVVAAPFALVFPLLGGWVADHFGYSPIFVGSAFAGLLALYVFIWRVQDPRMKDRKVAVPVSGAAS